MPPPDPGTPASDLSRAAAVVRLVLLVFVLATIGLVAVRTGPDVAAIRSFVADTGWIGPGVYVVAYAVLTVALVPGTVLTLSGGLLFGVAGGIALTMIGATLGAVLSFLVARRAGRAAVDRLAGGRVARVDDWLAARGLVAVLTLRLVPLVPFNVANYAAGVTALRVRDYVVGTALGIVPGVVVYTVLAARAQDPTGPAFLVALGALAVLAIGGTIAARRSGHGDAGDSSAARTSAEPSAS